MQQNTTKWTWAVRVVLTVIATFALTAFALCEFGLGLPISWWLYLLTAITFAFAFLRSAPLRSQVAHVRIIGVLCAVILALYFVPWTSRKPFLRDLNRIRVGMTESEVRRIMDGYMEGTSIPAAPLGWPSNDTGTLIDVGSGSTYSTGVSRSGDMTIADSLVFRHSNKGAYNADWGIVRLSQGRVVGVEFSPD